MIGVDWQRFASVTSNVPFAAIIGGRNQFSSMKSVEAGARRARAVFRARVLHPYLFGSDLTEECAAASSRSLSFAAVHSRSAGPFPEQAYPRHRHLPSGGANDILNRTLGAKLSESIGQPVLIDNKPGVGLRRRRDGRESSRRRVYAPRSDGSDPGLESAFFQESAVRHARDFAPVTMAVEVNYVLLVHPAVPRIRCAS